MACYSIYKYLQIVIYLLAAVLDMRIYVKFQSTIIALSLSLSPTYFKIFYGYWFHNNNTEVFLHCRRGWKYNVIARDFQKQHYYKGRYMYSALNIV